MRLVRHGKVITKVVVSAEFSPCTQYARCRVYECPIMLVNRLPLICQFYINLPIHVKKDLIRSLAMCQSNANHLQHRLPRQALPL